MQILPRKAHHFPTILMGCGFVLTAIDTNPQRAWDAIRAGVKEINRIETLISSWQESSETSAINRQAGIRPVRVSTELYRLIERSNKISKLTGGAFDISGTLARYYWKFDKQERPPLEEEKVLELRDLINYNHIELDPQQQTVFLQKRGMKIGFGGIGKGYAAQRAKEVMQQLGIASGLINASGDLISWGEALGTAQWEIKIPDPQAHKQSLLKFSIPNGSVVTSGNYENYTQWQGKRYSHIIDPRTGRPVETIKQVSVVCPQPEFADALATGISVLGADLGLHLVNHLNGVECIMIDENDGVIASNNLQHILTDLRIKTVADQQ
ncbi:MAG: FAD:protein FMN transferase [Saprospiraceae bacterium]